MDEITRQKCLTEDQQLGHPLIRCFNCGSSSKLGEKTVLSDPLTQETQNIVLCVCCWELYEAITIEEPPE
jgi:hypothetical protein